MLWVPSRKVPAARQSTTALASLCKKTTDIEDFAAANSLTVHSLYRLNDLGIWGDSSAASFQGYITGSGTSGTLNVASTQHGALTGSGTVTIAGPGVPGCPQACPTRRSALGPTYSLTWATAIGANVGSSGSPVAMTAGAFKPAAPLAVASFNGYIDNGGGSTPTLHVTSVPPAATFTGVLGNTFTGHIDDGVTVGAVGNVLTVTAVPGPAQYPMIGVGTVISGGTLSSPMTVTQVVTNPSGAGMTGIYNLSGTAQTVPAVNSAVWQWNPSRRGGLRPGLGTNGDGRDRHAVDRRGREYRPDDAATRRRFGSSGWRRGDLGRQPDLLSAEPHL